MIFGFTKYVGLISGPILEQWGPIFTMLAREAVGKMHDSTEWDGLTTGWEAIQI